jgi:hypothetical protein
MDPEEHSVCLCDLLQLPAEMLWCIFEKVSHKDWSACLLTSTKFFELSRGVFVTKLLTKMLSSEWLGKTQWCVSNHFLVDLTLRRSFQGKTLKVANDFRAYGDRTVSHFKFTKDGKVANDL